MSNHQELLKIYDELIARQNMGETHWVMKRGGGDAPQFWRKYTAAQNKRWFKDQLKRRIDHE